LGGFSKSLDILKEGQLGAFQPGKNDQPVFLGPGNSGRSTGDFNILSARHSFRSGKHRNSL
jgi:hypothetical protein